VEPNRQIDRHRLDVVLAQMERTTTDPATRAQIQAFESLIRARHKDWRRPDFASMREQLIDFIMPRVGNTGILHGVRYTEILSHVVEEVLPSLEENDEIIAIATALIEEELERHRELQDRIHEALDT
jgi:hypothetical protein